MLGWACGDSKKTTRRRGEVNVACRLKLVTCFLELILSFRLFSVAMLVCVGGGGGDRGLSLNLFVTPFRQSVHVLLRTLTRL